MTLNEELEGYLKIIEQFSPDMGQDVDALNSYLIQLTNYMARANFIMAEYRMLVRKKKQTEYDYLTRSKHSQELYFKPTLVKDYVDSACSELSNTYDLAERTSRACSHTTDAVRTIVSYLKEEMRLSKFGGS